MDAPSHVAEDQLQLHVTVAASADLTWENAAQNLKLEFVWAPVVDGNMGRALERWAKGKHIMALVCWWMATWVGLWRGWPKVST
jgi:hypothetical protein